VSEALMPVFASPLQRFARLAEAVTGPGPVDHHVGPGPTQVAHGFFGRGRHPHRGELAGPEQLR